MNDEPPSPFDIVGDEPVEARIVAWVLGEASAFEAAELERLCEERPELLVFRRRMRALHGLLTEAEASEADQSWKLPPEKRKLLDEICGEERVVRHLPEQEQGIHRSGRQAALAIAACLVISFAVFQLIPKGYESKTVVEVKPRGGGMSPLGSGMRETTGKASEQFFGTEFEKIKSRKLLEKVVDNLELTQRWRVDKDTALFRLKKNVTPKNIDGTDLIAIRVREKNQQDADEISFEVAKAYQAYRQETESKESELALYELAKAVRDQEDKVEERRKVLATIVRTKGINYKGQDSFYGSGVDEDQAARGALAQHNELQAQKMQLESQVNSLLKYDSDQLLRSASGLDLPDNVIRELYPKYLEANRQLSDLKIKGRGDRHPEVLAAGEKIKSMKSDLDEGIVNLRATLQAQLSMASDRLRNVEDMKDDTREDAIKRGLSNQDYADAKRDFETDQALLQTMKMKQIGETIASKMPDQNVIIHEVPASQRAEVASAMPASPAVPSESAAMTMSLAKAKDGFKEVQQDKRRERLGGATKSEPAVAEMEPQLPELAGSSAVAALPPPSASAFSTGVIAGTLGGGSGGVESDYHLTPESDEVVGGRGGKWASNALARGSDVQGKDSTVGLKSKSQVGNSGRIDADRSTLTGTGSGMLTLPSAQANLTYDEKASADGPTDLTPTLESKDPSARDPRARVVPPAAEPITPSAPESVAAATRLREVGKDDEARVLLEGIVAANPDDGTAKRNLGNLSDPIRSNPALTDKHTQNVDQVQKDLYTAEGNFNLGKYDAAKKSYDDVLKTDPNNTAAREGLERVSQASSDYYRAAYDHTRAELLSRVDAVWELSVPTEAPTLKQESKTDINELEQRSAKLRRQLEDPVCGKKQALFKEWKELQKQIEEAQGGPPLVQNIEVQPALIDLIEEIPASENPYSTFSLNISDASFQLAKAALAKGERPDPASIKPEQFYNAVDYGDPAPTSNEPVAATVEQSAHPILPGRNLVRVALRTASVGRSAIQPLHLTLLVDQSGSMVREDRRAAMEQALQQLAGLLTRNDRVTIIGFSRTPHLLADGLTGDQGAKFGDIINQTASEGGTNLEEAMKLAAQKAAEHQLAAAQNRIVLFTDGAANLGNADPENLAKQVTALRQRGIAFDIAGIGADGLNDKLLGELARHGNGRYYVVRSGNNDSFAKQLAGAFRPAAENVKVQVNFNPQRVGKYKLIGFEKDRLKTEDFRNDAVDAAELSADEAGVAIYQVETLAEGSGEIGEVSVRFRDAASKEMVERTWTMPHESSVVAFERATPSMQLAGLSLLAAEKLKGGPMADAIDFKLFTEPAASVKHFYGGSAPVADMLQIIEKLK